MSTRDSPGGKGDRCVGLTTYHPCSAERQEIRGLNLPGPPWAISTPCCGRDLYLYLNENWWSASRPGRFTPENEPYPLYREMGGPQGRSGRLRKISPSTGIQSLDLTTSTQSYRLRHPGPVNGWYSEENYGSGTEKTHTNRGKGKRCMVKKIEPGTTAVSVTPPRRCIKTAIYVAHAKVGRPYDDDDDDNNNINNNNNNNNNNNLEA